MTTVTKLPRRFILRRWHDVSKVSGDGDVASGTLFPDTGLVALHWGGEFPTVTTHVGGIAGVEAIHGHNGLTEIIWIDENEEENHAAAPTP